MNLRGIDFGHVLDASGARGWFGEGHPFHRWVPIGLSFSGSTFVAKTTTLKARDPNRALGSDNQTPRVLRQHCVHVDWRKGVVLNALGLPGPGLEALLATGHWQRWTEPFFLSFATIEETAEDRLDEVRRFVRILKAALPDFAAPVGLQVNFSCPNVPHDEPLPDSVAGFRADLDEYAALDVPLMVKLSATQPVADARAITAHPSCDALCVSNTIPWRQMPDLIDWQGLFGARSPLERFGGGGLSGAPLLQIVADWVREARRQGISVPINAGGGILGPADAEVLHRAGASSVFVGSIAILRGWRLARTIRYANRLFSKKTAVATAPAARASAAMPVAPTARAASSVEPSTSPVLSDASPGESPRLL
ncbi:MAG: hypothetical protein OXH52_05890 [Gammaproteobacteria bacterium]|nr:hypothetical protein [Gammaproteobacteria bacterium]